MQIIVLGTHRSGTSLTTGLIHMMGAYVGAGDAMLDVSRDNPKGFYERKDVMEVNEALLASWDSIWNDVSGLGAERPVTEVLSAKMRAIITELDAHRPWVLKDPRLCITFPEWRAFIEKPVIVMTHRNPLEIAYSLQLRDRYPLHLGLAIWEYYTVHALNSTRGLPVIYTDHAQMLSDPVGTTQRIYASLRPHAEGIHLPDEKEILAFIEPSLYQSKVTAPLHELLNEKQRALLPYITGEKPCTELLTPSEGAKDIMRRYRMYQLQDIKNGEAIAHLHDEVTKAHQSIQALHQEIGQLHAANHALQEELGFIDLLLNRSLSLRHTKSWQAMQMVARVAHKLLLRSGRQTDPLASIADELESFRKQ